MLLFLPVAGYRLPFYKKVGEKEVFFLPHLRFVLRTNPQGFKKPVGLRFLLSYGHHNAHGHGGNSHNGNDNDENDNTGGRTGFF